MTPELEQLVDVLDEHRAAVLRKVAGLSEVDARRSTVPSGTNLAGLLQHLTFVESKWFAGHRRQAGGSRGERSMAVASEVPLRDLRAAYKAECAHSNEVIAALGDADAPITHNGKQRNLRWVILAVLGEIARHAGHADIIREQVDGRTGR